MNYLLRIEGVNLFNFVLDTRKLPVIRGGSALLLDAPAKLKRSLFEGLGLELEEISGGASSGLFRITGDTDITEDVLEAAGEILGEDEDLRHATFVVDVEPETGGFQAAQERVLAANRWRQMQSLTTDVPRAETVASDKVACTFDGVRPAIHPLDGESDQLSESVKRRRARGDSGSRPGFYQDRSGLEAIRHAKFVQDFEDLAAWRPQSVPKNLTDKMAVIYLDGNKFGRRQSKAAESDGGHKLKEWDRKLRRLRRELLAAQLKRSQEGGEEWRNDGALRFETLLWGGDELIWVVPAWQGWSTLQFFYEHTAEWADHESVPLTHAGGLVFCHTKAPIHRITKLARDLAEIAKNGRDDKDRAAGNAFVYQVLESFDHVAGGLSEHLKSRRPVGLAKRVHVVSGPSQMAGFARIKYDLERKEFPKRKLFAAVRDLLDPEKVGDGMKAAKALKEEPKYKDELKNLDEMGFVHLLELWDYLPKGGDHVAA